MIKKIVLLSYIFIHCAHVNVWLIPHTPSSDWVHAASQVGVMVVKRAYSCNQFYFDSNHLNLLEPLIRLSIKQLPNSPGIKIGLPVKRGNQRLKIIGSVTRIETLNSALFDDRICGNTWCISLVHGILCRF